MMGHLGLHGPLDQRLGETLDDAVLTAEVIGRLIILY
jgi:hypothetical protein